MQQPILFSGYILNTMLLFSSFLSSIVVVVLEILRRFFSHWLTFLDYGEPFFWTFLATLPILTMTGESNTLPSKLSFSMIYGASLELHRRTKHLLLCPHIDQGSRSRKFHPLQSPLSLWISKTNTYSNRNISWTSLSNCSLLLLHWL